jgi:hypothetical protein
MRRGQASDSFPEKIDDPADNAAGRPGFKFDILQGTALARGPVQQAAGSSKGGSRRGFCQAAQRRGAAQTHGTIENFVGKITDAHELAGTAREHDAAGSGTAKARAIQPIPYHFKRFLQARPDYANHHAPRDFRQLVVFLADHLHGEIFAIILLHGVGVAI